MSETLEAAKTKRIRSVRRQLGKSAAGQKAALFAEILLSGGAGEDLAAYAPEALAREAEEAFGFLAQRKERTELRVFDAAEPDRTGRAFTTIEILTTNRPFIVDSVIGEIQACGHEILLVLHPILAVTRDRKGRLGDLGRAGPDQPKGAEAESFMHVRVARIASDAEKDALAARLAGVLEEVHVVTGDWQAMRTRLKAARDSLAGSASDGSRAEVEEALAFLDWLAEDNFLFLGMRDFSYESLDEQALQDGSGDGLGILRDPEVKVLRRGREGVTMTPEIRAFLMTREPLIVTKANVKSRVHRRDYMDYVGVKFFDARGRVTGELRIVGLFTSSAFTRSVQRIPLIRQKVAAIRDRAAFDRESHSGKALLNILEHYPRTELFQADADVLRASAIAVMQLGERPRVRALMRRDRFGRFVSVLVYVPRDRYSSDIRERIGAMLAEALGGHVSAYFPDFPEIALARVQFIIGLDSADPPQPEQSEIESRIAAIIRTWDDDLAAAIARAFPPEEATELARNCSRAFSPEYRAAHEAAMAVEDIAVVRHMEEGGVAARFGRRADMKPSHVLLRYHHAGSPIPLSRRVPLLENLGFSVVNERTYRISPADGQIVYLHEMTLASRDGEAVDLSRSGDPMRDTILAIRAGLAEDDSFNRLVLGAGFAWREAALMRTLARYLRQLQVAYSADYMAATLHEHAETARLLLARFVARFDPAMQDRPKAEARAERAVEAALQTVEALDDDIILRGFLQVIRAAQRTDFFVRGPDGEPPLAITLKIRPDLLPLVPAPRPYREIFVHSPQVEGVHMRFGPVARGGLRWSDRLQDYRVEVLGLAKAQQVKNAVIVPVGAKGGFVPLSAPASSDRQDVFENGRAAYIAFVERLLAVTDDIEGDVIVPPAGIVRHDGDDPYLVVAADKGTATFSDTANAIALERGFWLGDAFASGGSAGYDHKAMGITARGAWEAVKRHFREMDRDIQAEPFTTVGVGDMSGDVFGNGMLLSRQTRLVAAFDHRDIFVDPRPDPAASFAERERLFALPRSSWQDYDRKLISKGGGVFSRREKQIPVSPEMKRLFGIKKASLRPTELITAILTAPVDLLWFGGIGTYVRGPNESDAEVGDKANDAVRITALDLRARVVGEGANLGMTPRARIAYAQGGGRCNSDAVDNSGGVNSSDLEVNIKIALAPALRSGRLDTKRRNKLLESMTAEVAELVLRNNYQQTLAISLEAKRGPGALEGQERLMRELEGRGLLDREVETLPSSAEVRTRVAAGRGLTRPEIGSVMAFAKIALFNDLVVSDVPDDPYLSRELFRYFPEPMRVKYAAEIEAHRLRREIIATQLANAIVNRAGPTLPVALHDRIGAGAGDVARGYALVRDGFGLQALHAEIDALDAAVAGGAQLDLYAEVRDVLFDRVAWFIRNVHPGQGLGDVVEHYRAGLEALSETLPSLISREAADWVAEREARMKAAKVPAPLARRLAMLPILAGSTDAILVADETGRPLEQAAQAFFAIGRRFGVGRIHELIGRVESGDFYERLALQKARDALETAQRYLARSLVEASRGGIDLGAWEEARGGSIAAASRQIDSILAEERATTSRAIVASSILQEIARPA